MAGAVSARCQADAREYQHAEFAQHYLQPYATGKRQRRDVIPALIATVDFADEEVPGRCRGSRADNGEVMDRSLRRIEKGLMFGSKRGITSPRVGFDHRVADACRLLEELVPGLDEPRTCAGELLASARFANSKV